MTTTGAAPVLITGAAPSYEDQLAARKRRYLLLMSCRLPCLILAGVLQDIWWLALAVLAVSVPLPWMAVLIANDRPPRKTEKVSTLDRAPKQGSHVSGAYRGIYPSLETTGKARAMDGPTQPLSPDQPISPGTPEVPDLDVDPGQFLDEDPRHPSASPREEPPD